MSAPDFSTWLPEPLALDEVTLTSYAVLYDRLDLRLKCPRLQIDVAELLTHLTKINAGKYVIRCTLESLRLPQPYRRAALRQHSSHSIWPLLLIPPQIRVVVRHPHST